MERGDRPFRVGEGDEWVERPDLRAGGHRRVEHLRPEGAARMDHRLAAVHPDLVGQRRDRIVGDGQDDELDLLDEGLCLGERACPVDGAREPGSPRRIATGHGLDRPARPAETDAQGDADRARADDARRRRLARPRLVVRMGVSVRVDIAIVMSVVPGRDGVEVDPGVGDGGFHLGPVALRIVTRQAPPGLHPDAPAQPRGRARYACILRV